MRYHGFVASSAKTLQKMRRNQSGWRMEDLLEVADGNGVEWRGAGRAGVEVT